MYMQLKTCVPEADINKGVISVGCNYSSLPLIPASATYVINCICRSRTIRLPDAKYLDIRDDPVVLCQVCIVLNAWAFFIFCNGMMKVIVTLNLLSGRPVAALTTKFDMFWLLYSLIYPIYSIYSIFIENYLPLYCVQMLLLCKLQNRWTDFSTLFT